MKRIDKVRAYLAQEHIDAIWITNEKNLRYLANFTGSAGEALITKDQAYFVTDFRYKEQASKQAQGFEVVIHSGDLYGQINDLLKEEGINRLAIEADHINLSLFRELENLLDCQLIESQGVVEDIRQIKDEEELATIQEACRITDLAFDHILTYIKPGLTEIQVANELEHYLKGLGAEGMSFETIVASGYRSSMPHGVASDKVIEEGDLVTLDFGCYYQGYSSDMTRTIAVGDIDPKLKEIYQIVLEAHLKVIDEAKAGMTGKEIDAIARDYITAKGYGPDFGHSTGHGVGLDVHEKPAVSMKSDDIMQENMVITDEPGIYLEGLGGVRIEDDLIIKKDGVQLLNKAPKELIIL